MNVDALCFDESGDASSEIAQLQQLGGEIDISEISGEIEMEQIDDKLFFKYENLVLGFIHFNVHSNAIKIEFMGNSNMSINSQECYSTEYYGLYSLEDYFIRIKGLGEYMLSEFIEYIKTYFPKITRLEAEIDNPRTIILFSNLRALNIIKGIEESISPDEMGFSRKNLHVSI